MSFLGFGRPQPSSAERVAAVENELRVVAEMHARYVHPMKTTQQMSIHIYPHVYPFKKKEKRESKKENKKKQS